jgi:hypothetical protein
MSVQNAKELRAYQLAYKLAMDIFELSKDFPSEEKFALTSQIRRSSRSVSMNLREAWAKRRYEAHFISKLTDCDGVPRRETTTRPGAKRTGSNGETETSLDFAFDCGYITEEQHHDLVETNNQIGRLLGSMLCNPEQWILKS